MPGTVLITGASSGIGLELARECTRHGHGLVLVARRADRLEEAAAELRERVQVEVVVSDLSERNACQALYDRLDEREIEGDYLVNNAGFGLYGPFVEGDAARQQEMIAEVAANRAKFVLAEAEVPKSMAHAFRSGNLTADPSENGT